MSDTVTLTGMVLVASPLKEYDRRIEILTRERGRISAFARGARKANSPLSACTIPFTYGQFTLYQGRDAYSLQSASIGRYFGDIADDYDKTCYASYFAEMAAYFTRENLEAPEELLLLYVTLAALQHGQVPLPLTRIIYEMRMMQTAGQGIELFECLGCHQTGSRNVYFQAGGLLCEECASKEKETREAYPFTLSADALYVLQYILSSPLEKLYSFQVTEDVLKELERFMKSYLGRFLPHAFKALEFLTSN